jgi:polyhydroxyalkanoate synthesis regulator phasin
MPETPDWKRALETGMQFTELRRSQARQLASELVAQGQLARDQVSTAVDELVELSRRRSDAFRAVVRNEVQRQLGALGLATKADLAALERKLTKATKATAKKSAKKSAKKVAEKASKKGPAKKAPAKKAGAKARTASAPAPRTTSTAS